jgi:hypothetical protein
MATSTAPSRTAHPFLPSNCGFIVRMLIAALTCTVLTCSLVAAPSAMAQSRGELLYTTHCIACHTTEMHWRDRRAASNWPSLRDQVRRWQEAASLAWTDSEILDVARYLNETIYRFEQTADRVSASGRGFNEPPPSVLLRAELPSWAHSVSLARTRGQ